MSSRRLVFPSLLLLTASCGSVVTVVMPYCPVSDSAWQQADSVPAICVLADSTRQHR